MFATVSRLLSRLRNHPGHHSKNSAMLIFGVSLLNIKYQFFLQPIFSMRPLPGAFSLSP